MSTISDFLLSWVRAERRRKRSEVEDEGNLFYALTIHPDSIRSSERNQNKISKVSAAPVNGERSFGD
jgi:hypothetical protein